MSDSPAVRPPRGINTGAGRTLIALYALFAVAGTGRSTAQLVHDAGAAPFAYTLSALAALIYVAATICLVIGDRARGIAIVACTIEIVGVILIGTLSYLRPHLFPDRTIWSHFGGGYFYVPLVLPASGLWWLLRAYPRSVRIPETRKAS